jgi:hypothetical protein
LIDCDRRLSEEGKGRSSSSIGLSLLKSANPIACI